MRKLLYIKENIFFSHYLRLFCNGRPENMSTYVLKLGQARLHLNAANNTANCM